LDKVPDEAAPELAAKLGAKETRAARPSLGQGEKLPLPELPDGLLREGILDPTPEVRVRTGASLRLPVLRLPDQVDLQHLQPRAQQARGSAGILHRRLRGRDLHGRQTQYYAHAYQQSDQLINALHE
jgi:hypothetical protein